MHPNSLIHPNLQSRTITHCRSPKLTIMHSQLTVLHTDLQSHTPTQCRSPQLTVVHPNSLSLTLTHRHASQPTVMHPNSLPCTPNSLSFTYCSPTHCLAPQLSCSPTHYHAPQLTVMHPNIKSHTTTHSHAAQLTILHPTHCQPSHFISMDPTSLSCTPPHCHAPQQATNSHAPPN